MSTPLLDPTPPRRRLLVQIVLGAAWVDGRLDPAEVAYLERLLQRERLEHDPDLKVLLRDPVSVPQTEAWMAQYLVHASEEERQALLGAIGNLMMADDQITVQEHHLLDDFYTLMERIPTPLELPLSPQEVARHLVKGVGSLFKKVTRALGA